MSDGLVGYALSPVMPGLVACPFCREMYQRGEREVCPDCDLRLLRIEDLPETKVVGGELEAELPPDEETLPWTYAGRGRGALVLVAALGIAAFFLPWAHEIVPERMTMTGPQIARQLGWMWAPLVAWMVLIPLVMSRRSVHRMRGARVAAAFLSAIALLTAAIRVLFPPTGSALDPHRMEWGLGLWMTAGLGAIGVAFALGFGGPIDDLTTKTAQRPRDATLH